MREVHSEGYSGPERRDVSWHLDKRVSVSQITAIVLIFFAGVGVYNDLKNSVQHNAMEIQFLQSQYSDSSKRVAESLAGINSKLDRIYEDMLNQARNGAKHK